jgi:hypothetical protein
MSRGSTRFSGFRALGCPRYGMNRGPTCQPAGLFSKSARTLRRRQERISSSPRLSVVDLGDQCPRSLPSFLGQATDALRLRCISKGAVGVSGHLVRAVSLELTPELAGHDET